MFLWKRPLDTVLHYGQVLTKLRLCPKWEKSNGPVIDQNVSSIFLSRITQKSGYIADYSQKNGWFFCRGEHGNIYVTEF